MTFVISSLNIPVNCKDFRMAVKIPDVNIPKPALSKIEFTLGEKISFKEMIKHSNDKTISIQVKFLKIQALDFFKYSSNLFDI